ncbi:Transcription factor, MADS-box [Dillenia turbinata]|uniref:Transcription factor, MADS-box n=1 Tax=Dillenia turbinata TaxID=194707 RepID=A0AAN8VKS5_9MAGN
MARKKLKLAFIENAAKRKVTCKKRMMGLQKKVSELSTVCGVQVCGIIHNHDDKTTTTLPSTIEALGVIAKFQEMNGLSKNTMNQESFLDNKLARAHEKLRKLQAENRENEMELVVRQTLNGKMVHNLHMINLPDLVCVLEKKKRELVSRINSLEEEMLTLRLAPLPNLDQNPSNNMVAERASLRLDVVRRATEPVTCSHQAFQP